jgi:hypothetical protein
MERISSTVIDSSVEKALLKGKLIGITSELHEFSWQEKKI